MKLLKKSFARHNQKTFIDGGLRDLEVFPSPQCLPYSDPRFQHTARDTAVQMYHGLINRSVPRQLFILQVPAGEMAAGKSQYPAIPESAIESYCTGAWSTGQESVLNGISGNPSAELTLPTKVLPKP